MKRLAPGRGMDLSRHLSRHNPLAFCGYLLVALYLVAAALPSFSTRFIGGDSGGVYEMARHVWWYKTALENGQDVFYQSLLAYPDGFPSAQLWANPLQFFPMWLFAFVMPLASAYNLGALLTLALNGWAMYVFARQRITAAHGFPGWIAGLVYMIFPIMQGHLYAGHAGLLAQWPPPLLLLCLYRYVDIGRKRWLSLSLLFFLLSAMGHSLQFLYLLAPLMLMFLCARLYRRDFVGAARTALVALTGSLLLLAFLWPITRETLSSPLYTEAGGYTRYSIDLLGIASPSYANPFWRDIATHSKAVLQANIGEGASYVGIAGGLLALIGLVFRRQSRWWLALAILAWLLALGPVLKVFDEPLTLSIAGYSTVIPLPFAFLMSLPGAEFARAPGRFMFLFAIALSIMAGHGMLFLWTRSLFQRRGRLFRAVMAVGIAFFIFHDYQLFAEFPSVRAAIPRELRALNLRGDIRAIYSAPHDSLLAVKEAMYLQTAHGKALIGGHDARVAPVDPARLELLSSFQPSLLKEAGADAVIINKARALESGQFNALYPRARARLGQPAFEDARYALFEVQLPPAAEREDLVFSALADGGSHVVYVYKEQPGWLDFRAELSAQNRRVNLMLNDSPLQSVDVIGRTTLSLPLPIARRGYNTFRIMLNPPCPERIDTTVLLCHDVSMNAVQLLPLSDGAIYDPARIEGGIELAGYYMPPSIDGQLDIHLWWRFDSPRSIRDQRFIHVLNANRVLVRQHDISFGDVSAGYDYLETARLDVSGFPPGKYSVLTGWYALPDMNRYDVLTSVDGAQDSTIVLGAFTVPAG